MRNLDDTSGSQVEISESHKTSTLGDDRKATALQWQNYLHKLVIPNALSRLKIVKQKIPLLLRKTSLKKVGTVLNFKNDNINVQ